MQTIAAANLKVLDIVARWAGSNHDQHIFRNSTICNRFEEGHFGRYILIGDSGYANTEYLATPFTATNAQIQNDPVMQTYQANIISTRNVVERQYGVMKRRFPALAYGMRVKVSTAQKIITAAAILHNICIDENDHAFDEDIDNMQNDDGDINDGNVGNADEIPQRMNARDQIIQLYRNNE